MYTNFIPERSLRYSEIMPMFVGTRHIYYFLALDSTETGRFFGVDLTNNYLRFIGSESFSDVTVFDATSVTVNPATGLLYFDVNLEGVSISKLDGFAQIQVLSNSGTYKKVLSEFPIKFKTLL